MTRSKFRLGIFAGLLFAVSLSAAPLTFFFTGQQ